MQNRHVLITGGTGGLGTAVLRAVYARGGRITATYLNEQGLERARAALPAEIASAIAWERVDVSVEADVERAVSAMERVEVVLHLAGGFAMAPTESVSLADWKALLDLNMTSTFLVLKHVLEPIRSAKYGRIVTIGSRTGAQPGANTAAYAASKAGVTALTAVAAAELRGIDATANCVLPSIIDTPGNRASMPRANYADWVAPESLAEVICFLGSEAARDLRGAAIPVYGRA